MHRLAAPAAVTRRPEYAWPLAHRHTARAAQHEGLVLDRPDRLAGLLLHFVSGDGDGEAAADPAVRAGARTWNDGHWRAGGHVVRTGARVDRLVAGHRDELLVQLGDGELERPAGQLQFQVMGV